MLAGGQCVLVMRAIFRICGNESQLCLQLVKKLAMPLAALSKYIQVPVVQKVESAINIGQYRDQYLG